jgi:hypothetical protein
VGDLLRNATEVSAVIVRVVEIAIQSLSRLV